MDIKIRDIYEPELLDFKRIGSSTLGYISIAEKLPFEIKRVYWTYYAPHEVIRGHHAHKELSQVIFAVSGTIKFELENVRGVKQLFTLERPEMGLYIPRLHWRTMEFSHNAVLLCLASEVFDESDYMRDYNDFKKLTLK
jgi:dTDP-4-dehydrorhamnose 3,5-epimerase-like enzyme